MEEVEYNINTDKLQEYAIHVKDWCLVNGLICIENKPDSVKSHDLAYPCPVTLVPTKFPKKQFDIAMGLQHDFNQLFHNLCNDSDFLRESLKDVNEVDDFMRGFMNIYEKVQSEGEAQPITLSILRNDFMLDMNKRDKEIWLSQIEINTSSVSFGAATSQMVKLHNNTLKYTNNDQFLSKQISNDNITVMAKGIVEAWKLYDNPKAIVAFIVSETERNIGDQRLLENRCYDLESSIKIKRFSFLQIHKRAKLLDDKRLIIDEADEIALVYFRSGYSPRCYTTQDIWDARLLIERSMAIKSPNIQSQLVGAKKIQQALTNPSILQKFVQNKDIADKLQSTFVDQYSFEKENLDERIQFMLDNCEQFVLKPQREGGGNNIYRDDIRKFYNELTDKNELLGYILMRMVEPYTSKNFIIKANSEVTEEPELISELGIFGVVISKSNSVLLSETGGYLVRSKSATVNEGGVATGYAALDSLVLI